MAPIIRYDLDEILFVLEWNKHNYGISTNKSIIYISDMILRHISNAQTPWRYSNILMKSKMRVN